MATFTTSQVASTVQPRVSNGVVAVTAQYELTAALAADDIIQAIKVAKGQTILEVTLQTSDLDTDVSPAIVLAVGDGTVADRYITGSTVGQAGGVAYANKTSSVSSNVIVNGLGYKYTADDTIDIKVTTGPATGAATGILVLTVVMSNET